MVRVQTARGPIDQTLVPGYRVLRVNFVLPNSIVNSPDGGGLSGPRLVCITQRFLKLDRQRSTHFYFASLCNEHPAVEDSGRNADEHVKERRRTDSVDGVQPRKVASQLGLGRQAQGMEHDAPYAWLPQIADQARDAFLS